MKNHRVPTSVLAGVLAFVLSMTGCRKDPDTLVREGYDEQAMEAAIERARQELPDFIAALRARAGTDFAVKVPIEEGDEVEHFWLTGVVLRGNEFHGEIGNDPGIVRRVRLGQPWSATTNEISDWMFLRDHKLHGNYTLRPLLETMSPDEANDWRKRFAKP